MFSARVQCAQSTGFPAVSAHMMCVLMDGTYRKDKAHNRKLANDTPDDCTIRLIRGVLTMLQSSVDGRHKGCATQRPESTLGSVSDAASFTLSHLGGRSQRSGRLCFHMRRCG